MEPAPSCGLIDPVRLCWKKSDFSITSGYQLHTGSWLGFGAHVYYSPFSVLVPIWFDSPQACVCGFLFINGVLIGKKKPTSFCHLHFLLHKNHQAVSQMFFIKLDSVMLIALKRPKQWTLL